MKTSKTINGLEVIAREQAIGQHPRWPDRMVPFNGVTKVLLSDGTEVYECDDRECDYVANTVKSVTSHMPKHSDKAPSLYDDETLEKVVRVVLKAKRDGHRGYMERAAAVLNHQGLTTYSGAAWNGSNVSSLFAAHSHRFPHVRVRVTPVPSTVVKTAASTAIAEPTTKPAIKLTRKHKPADVDDTATLADIAHAVLKFSNETADLVARAAELRETATALVAVMKTKTTDPEVVRKAKQFDAMMAAANGTGTTKK